MFYFITNDGIVCHRRQCHDFFITEDNVTSDFSDQSLMNRHLESSVHK